MTDGFGEPRTSKITPTLLVPILWNFRHIFAMMNLPDPEPMMSLDKFLEQTGLSNTTVWRYRKQGILNTVNIYGRQYILRSEIARFNARAASGEFARTARVPRRSKH